MLYCWVFNENPSGSCTANSIPDVCEADSIPDVCEANSVGFVFDEPGLNVREANFIKFVCDELLEP